MTGILEGKELDQKIGDFGNVSIDVDKELNVELIVSLAKELEGASVSNDLKAKVHLFEILKKVCAKNNVTWDEALLEQLKVILGLVG